MWLLSTTLELGLPTALGIIGLAALVFVALRFNREDAGATVTQYGDVVRGMRDLLDERAIALDRCRAERTLIEAQLKDKIVEQAVLEAELRKLRRQVRE
jgi:hypothetical protein